MSLDKKFLKKSLIIITLILLSITIYQIVRTYSLLQSEVSGVANQAIAKWNIELNGEDITNGRTEEIEITDFEFIADSNVKEGKIAPGVYGMIDVTLDPKDTDVSARYDITLGDVGQQPITIESIEIVDGTGTLTKTAANTYTGVMNLNKIKNNTAKVTIRVTVLWANDESKNDEDTKIGTQSGYTLNVPLDVTVTQYLGEEIEEYT